MKMRFILLAFLFAGSIQAQQLAWPGITKENKPWTRWWWPGNIVTQNDLTAAMELYSKAGLGGMEITAIYGVKGYEDRFINYLSPKWMEMLTHTLSEGQRLDLGIELANASGWPFGGPWVDPSDACKNINYKTYKLRSGEKLNEKVVFIQPAVLRPVGQKPDISKLLDPISKNRDLQLYAIDQIRFEKPVPLEILVAYSDSGEAYNLTNLVTPERDLNWTAPPGEWTLYALFEGWHGKLAERAGPGGEGDVIDHFSGKAIDNFLKHFDTIFKDYDLRYLRGYFNDSYEVDDASGQANWTNDLFFEFRLRRGYDLALHLPALFQKSDPVENARVLSDYRLTLSDLILEKFTTRWTEWAHRQGKSTRNQAHGSPGNILDLYAASDIPEAEGNEITRFKFASSAANVSGKKYASCEAATWLNEHFISTLADVKKAVDLFFLGGINHVFYHGTCFSPKDDPWPGFLFYAATEFTPANPFWNDFPALNMYITRVQSFLQQGMSDNDVLLYFPVFDRYADYGKGMLEHFDGISPAFNESAFKTAAEEMLDKGFAYDFISDLQIKNTVYYEGLLQTEGNIYKTLILPACKYIPLETFAMILNFARDGGKIILYGGLPENVSGWADLKEKTEIFEQLKQGINFRATNNPAVQRTTYGNGMILTGNDLEQLLLFAGIRQETMSAGGLRFIRRETPEGFTYFINNQSNTAFNGWVNLTVNAATSALFDPMTGEYGLAEQRLQKNGNTGVYLKLYPGESIIVNAYKNKKEGKPWVFYNPSSVRNELKGEWKVRFTDGGPVLPSETTIKDLVSWTDFAGEDGKNFSGSAVYSINFTRPKEKADIWILNLGKVCESASVTLNGKSLGSLIGPDFEIKIPGKLLKKQNILEVRVSNLMANRIAYMDRNSIPWKKFYNINMAARLRQNTKDGLFDASSWQPSPSGLLGPVTITPMKIVK
jgi:hypothetical protein